MVTVAALVRSERNGEAALLAVALGEHALGAAGAGAVPASSAVAAVDENGDRLWYTGSLECAI
eukprot:2759161-Amphidinium_carterae.1